MENNDIEIYSTHYEGKSVAAEIFIRTLRNMYIVKLVGIVNKYNNE